MKIKLLALVVVALSVHNVATAYTYTTAPKVSSKKTSAIDTGASLVPNVIALIGGIKQISQQQKVLTDNCIPTAQEIDFVNKMVKEWAKTGSITATDAQKALGTKPCSQPTGGYQASVRISADTDEEAVICHDWFGGSSDKDMVWEGFPMASKTYYCTDGSLSGCAEKYRKEVSNMYDIFNLIDFSSDQDYTAQELQSQMASKIITKTEQCSYSKLNAKKKALWQDFLINSVGTLGQKTNTSAIMQAVGNATSGGGNIIQNLGSTVTNFIAQ